MDTTMSARSANPSDALTDTVAASVELGDTAASSNELAATPVDPSPPGAEPAERPSVPPTAPRRYEIVREVGHGGLGRILEARDRTLDRRVAIKELRIAQRGRARFLREALVTARLQHPSIVPLYDVGAWETGEPYYSMRLVSGQPLDAVIAKTKSLDERLALLPHVIAVADAMAFAHSERIIHRDLKPANVLVGSFGETVVIDWGLAKELGTGDPEPDDGPFRTPESYALTQAGEVLGTPVYMSPEQALGRELDARTDVYAIGAILYELLTGVWPHRGATSAQVIEKLVAGEQIIRIEEQQPDVPPELATIVNRAMTFERDARYPSAAELAADLRRFQTGQLVAAHRYSRATLLRRWVRRHRAAVAVAAVMVAALAVTIAISVRGILRERDATRAERDVTRAERDRLILAQANGELDRDPTAAIAWLKRYPASGGEPERARELALQARARGVARHVLPRSESSMMGRFSPDGTRYAQPHEAGLHVVELATGRRIGPRTGARMVEWAPDGKRLLVNQVAPNRTVIVELATSDERPIAVDLARTNPATIFSRDGRSLVLHTSSGTLVRRAADGASQPEWTPFAITDYVRAADRYLARSPDGVATWWDSHERVAHPLALPPGVELVPVSEGARFVDDHKLVAATTDGRIGLWTLGDGTLQLLDAGAVTLRMLRTSGDTIVTLDVKSRLRVHSLASGTSRMLPELGAINDMVLSTDGNSLALALGDHRVALVDPRTGDLRVVGRHPGPVHRVELSSDAKWIASDGEDGTTRLWQTGVTGTQLAEQVGWVGDLALSHDERSIAIAGGRALIWSGRSRAPLEGHTGDVRVAAFGATLLATGGMDHTIRTWDAAGRATGPALDAKRGMIRALHWLRSSSTLVSLHERAEVLAWSVDTRTSRSLATLRDARRMAVAPDEQLVAVGDATGLHLLSLSGSAARTLSVGEPVSDVAFSPDGRRIVAGTTTGRVLHWELSTGVQRELGRQRGIVFPVVVSADGRQVASASSQGDVALWNLDTGTQTPLVGHAGPVWRFAFVGDRVVSAGEDGTIRSWTFGGRMQSLVRANDRISALAVTASTVIAGTANGLVVHWPRAALADVPAASGPDDLTYAVLHETRLSNAD